MIRKIAFALLLVSFAGSAYAGTKGGDCDSTGAPTGIQGFNKSKGVNVVWGSAASGGAGQPKDVYAIATKHDQGDKIYGSTSASSYVWFKSGTSGTAIVVADGPTIPNSPSDSAVTKGFSQM